MRCGVLLSSGLAVRESVANKKCSACNRATEQSPTLALRSPLVLSDPVLNYERMWVSPFSKLKGNICLINVILICLYWTLNNNLPSSHSLVCLPECTCFLRSDFLNIYLWDLSNFSIDWWDTAPVHCSLKLSVGWTWT